MRKLPTKRRQDVAGDCEDAAPAMVGEARISRQKEMDVSIAAKAVFESF